MLLVGQQVVGDIVADKPSGTSAVVGAFRSEIDSVHIAQVKHIDRLIESVRKDSVW